MASFCFTVEFEALLQALFRFDWTSEYRYILAVNNSVRISMVPILFYYPRCRLTCDFSNLVL